MTPPDHLPDAATRAVLEARARVLAALPRAPGADTAAADLLGDVEPGLLVRTRRGTWFLATSEAFAVAPWLAHARVPGGPRALVGLVTVRGRIVPAFDLDAVLLGVPPRVPEPGARATLVVVGVPRPEAGFVVEEALGFGLPRRGNAPGAASFAGASAHAERITSEGVVVVDLAACLADPSTRCAPRRPPSPRNDP